MGSVRYLVLRAVGDPVEAWTQILDNYGAFVGYLALAHPPPRLMGIYGDLIVVGVPRGLVDHFRALVFVLGVAYTVRTTGTLRKAVRTALSARKT